MLAVRDALTPSVRAAASATIAEAACALLVAELRPGARVAMYASKGSEVDTAGLDALLRARGFAPAYPRIIDGDRRLEFAEAHPDELVAARFGLREPAAAAPALALADLAAFVMPGIAFDRAGARIGWGRGHYDATLAAAPPSALRVGLSFDCQLVDRVATDPHDVPLHFVITEAATYRVAD